MKYLGVIEIFKWLNTISSENITFWAASVNLQYMIYLLMPPYNSTNIRLPPLHKILKETLPIATCNLSDCHNQSIVNLKVV